MPCHQLGEETSAGSGMGDSLLCVCWGPMLTFYFPCAWARSCVTNGNDDRTQSLVPVCASHFRAACAPSFLEPVTPMVMAHSIPALGD